MPDTETKSKRCELGIERGINITPSLSFPFVPLLVTANVRWKADFYFFRAAGRGSRRSFCFSQVLIDILPEIVTFHNGSCVLWHASNPIGHDEECLRPQEWSIAEISIMRDYFYDDLNFFTLKKFIVCAREIY